MTKRFILATAGLAIAITMFSAAFLAGVAYAADAKFDLAVDSLIKAKAQLNAAENPGFDPPFNYHRQRAVRHINSALKEIESAKFYADYLNPPTP